MRIHNSKKTNSIINTALILKIMLNKIHNRMIKTYKKSNQIWFLRKCNPKQLKIYKNILFKFLNNKNLFKNLLILK